MANEKYATHADFTIEQHDYIQKNIRVVGKKDAFWSAFTMKDTMPKADKIKYRHQILLSKGKVNVLTEGYTPDPTSVAVVEFSESVFNIGSWFKYTREARDLNIDSVVEMGSNQLAFERLEDLETIRSTAFMGTTVAATKESTWEATLLKIKTQLKKNKAKPDSDGNFIFIAPGEIMNAITVELGDKLKAVPAGEKGILRGFIGACCGFKFVENDDDVLYTSTTADNVTTDYAIALAIGRNQFGEWPVRERSYAGTNDHVANIGCNPSKDDPLGQFGLVSSRIDGVGAVLTDEQCVVKVIGGANLPGVAVTVIAGNYNPTPTLSEVTTSPYVKYNHQKVVVSGAGGNAVITNSTEAAQVEAEYDD